MKNLWLLLVLAPTCSSCAAPSSHAAGPPHTPAEGAAAPILPALRPSDRSLATKVRALVQRGGPAEVAAVREELSRLARDLLDPAWVASARPKVEHANAAAGLAPTPAQLAAQIEAWRTELLRNLFNAMQELRAPEYAPLIFSVAADRAAPLERRKLALSALDAIVGAQDTTTAQQREALRRELFALQQTADADPGADLVRRVGEMRAPFRLCYQEQLVREPGAAYHGRVRFRIDPNGQVSSVSITDLSEGMMPCVEAIVRATHFAPTAEPRTVEFPLTFVPEPGSIPAPSVPAPTPDTAR